MIRILYYLKVIIGGIVMVVTDTIPGLSGAVFLSAGKLLKSVWNKWVDILKPKQKKDRWMAIIFYIFFGIGTTAGMLGFAKIIEICLDKIPVITFWFFLIASIGGIFIFYKGNNKSINSKLSWRKKFLFLSFGVIIIAVIIIIMITTNGRINYSDLRSNAVRQELNINNTKLMTLICLAGFFSAFAMFTPGLSGGLVILVFGVYPQIFGGLLANPMKHVEILAIYSVCVIAGIITSIFTWERLFEKFSEKLIWLLFGFVITSVIAIPIIFNIFIPGDNIKWWYILLSSSISGILVIITIFLMKGKDVFV